MNKNLKNKYLSSAFLLLITSLIVKIIGAVYKIPLTAYIGATGRGYFANAYNLCIPIHGITMGAFPVALSKLVSKYNACGDKKRLKALRVGADRLFFAVGITGTALMMLFAKPYAKYIASSPDCIYTVAVLAPSILFSCLAASYRGYYEGFLNMVPTSVSQLIEAVFKMVFGILFARVSMWYLISEYQKVGTVLGTLASSEQEALSMIYPYTSAGAMMGVTLGSLVSLAYVFLYHKIKCDRAIERIKDYGSPAVKELLSFAFPIMISCAVQSVFQFLDTASIQYSLGNADLSLLKSVYAESLEFAGSSDKDVVTYVYGLFSTALDFKNLIPGITMALGVSAVPAISAAVEVKDKEKLSSLCTCVFKYTTLLSVFGGFFIALNSREILTLFYSSSQDIVDGCDEIVKLFSLTVPVYSIAGTAVFAVQAIGKPEKSILPYCVSGAIRVVLNMLLVSNSKFILNGAVIAGFAGYFIMALWNIVIALRETKMKFSFSQALIKPIFAGICLYFCADYIFKTINLGLGLFMTLVVKGILCVIIFAVLCLIFGCLSLNEIKSFINCKKYSLNT